MMRYHFVIPDAYREEGEKHRFVVEAPTYSLASEALRKKTYLHSFCSIEKTERCMEGVWIPICN